jgi:superfamily II DNA or RNA helicase
VSLRDLQLKYKYRSDEDIIYRDFYNPCIGKAVKYDRAAGYFTSDSLKLIAKSLEKFINTGGTIRIISNPYLSEQDVDAIIRGTKSREEAILDSMLLQMRLTSKEIENNTLNVLAWLIYMGKLEFKIAYTEDNDSLYHEKFGVFYDEEDNRIAFSGSSNETIGGLMKNFEKVDVFFRETDKERIDDMIRDFDKLWNNATKGLKVINIPESIKEELLKHKSTDIKDIFKNKKVFKPREYQNEALEEAVANGYRGILEMATGTGKTLTSLYIANDYYELKQRIFLIIVVPFVHLVDQWLESCELMGFNKPILCFASKKVWRNKLSSTIRDYNIGLSRKELIITTYNTAASEEFNEEINRIRGKAFMIGDECHYFGIKSLINHRFHKIDGRIGLSATPARWWDDKGTERLREFFCNTIFEYTLEMAIEKGALTRYTYDPVIVELLPEEKQRYEKLTKRIIYLKENGDEEELQKAYRDRSLVLSKAENKKGILYSMLRKKGIENIQHTLVYCAPGEINSIVKSISDMGIRVHKFNADLSREERGEVLKAFEIAAIQLLVAIKCLDEGVDVPSTKVAYFLASTSNPREFVQRRGRVLRNSSGKTFAEIIDFIVLPENCEECTFKSIAGKEIPRFAEFSRYAINQYEARSRVKGILSRYQLEYLMDKLPWEIYEEIKDERKTDEWI